MTLRSSFMEKPVNLFKHIICFCFFSLPYLLFAQENPLERKVSITIEDQKIETALVLIGNKIDVAFSYNSEIIPGDSIISIQFENSSLKMVLSSMLPPEIEYKAAGGQVILVAKLIQTIRGRLVDIDSKMPVIGATIQILDSDPLVGTTTDLDGYFKLEEIAVGRVSLKVSYIGYEPKIISNVLVNSGKEVYLDIGIIENLTQLKEVEIKAYTDKREALNEMSIMSTRTFSIEETKRYSGSLNDPARMVANYAGISGNAQGNNDIVVRGNSPKGILWRLEGIEIPNPNHYGNEGTTGGPISALNSSMLGDFDFLTGAFAPEYGNTTSGVFDMRLRKGNNEKREYSFGLGLLGIDFTAEGPFKKGGKSSYLANYRYSSLGLLDEAGIVDFGGVPKYQDASFKLNFPTQKMGTISIFGLAGLSHITNELKDSSNAENIYKRVDNAANLGVVGINNIYLLNNKTYIKSSLSFAANGSGFIFEERTSDNIMELTYKYRTEKYTGKMSTSLNRKINSKNTASAGLIYTHMKYSFITEYVDENKETTSLIDENANSGYLQGYVNWKHRFNDDITMVGGLHYLHFTLNNSYSIEPRLAAKWKVSDKQTLSAGFGIHSKMESLLNYVVKVEDDSGNITTPNKSLKLAKANHYVAGYDCQFNKNTHIKLEAYYQQLYDIPVANDKSSAYSLLNQINWFPDEGQELVNNGKGYNYGLELTFERFFAKNFYYLFTASVYESKYKTMDNVWRKTRFDGNYNANFLFGKEFKIGRKKGKNKVMKLDVKTTLLGGYRYTPIDLEESRNKGRAVRTDVNPFSVKRDDVFFINIAGGYKVNRPKATHEIKFEVLNVTNNSAKVTEYYNERTEEIVQNKQLPLIPNIIYTVQF